MHLCDRCLGRRLTGAVGAEIQIEAGAHYRSENGGLAEVTAADCRVCEGRWDVDTWVQLAADALASYEHTNFQVGTVFPIPCEQYEKSWKHLNPEIGDSIRTETNRIIAPLLAAKLGTEAVTDGRPDVVVSVDTRFWTASARSNSLFVAGRYTKHRRDLPQTHWPCKTCQGTGCYQCEDSGVMYPDSVEDCIGQPAKTAFDAEGYSFHGAGREDIDALMLGTGRPFVLELHDPKRRTLDAPALEAAINATTSERGTGVLALRLTEKAEVAAIKEAAYDKHYLAHCETEEDLTEAQIIAACEAMTGAELDQRTPQRVSHRRADLIRNRTIQNMTLERMDDPRHFAVAVHADSGAYIKEMISSDEGRTTPSLAEKLGVACRVTLLDVTEIVDDEPATAHEPGAPPAPATTD